MTAARGVAIIGGGPGGLLAADVLSGAGYSVTVFEQMRSVGRKFLLAGRGGLNLTHSEPLDQFLSKFGPDRVFLEPAIRAFTPDDLRAWCYGLDEATFIGSSGRVFPESFRATPLLRALLARLAQQGVEFRTRHHWTGWDSSGASTFEVEGAQIAHAAEHTILALGGASWPGTGSNASWVPVLSDAGVDVVGLRAANCGFVVEWSRHVVRFAGTPLKNVAITHSGVAVRGEAMITNSGVEGGAIYALSRKLRHDIETLGDANVAIDLQPDRTNADVATRLNSRKSKETTTNWLRRTLALTPAAIAVLRDGLHNELPNDPGELARAVKAVPLRFVGISPLDRAISTAGGIAKHEIDDDFQLRKLAGVFAVGEMLDWEAPTGGYLLQATFSTAVAAAQGLIARDQLAVQNAEY